MRPGLSLVCVLLSMPLLAAAPATQAAATILARGTDVSVTVPGSFSVDKAKTGDLVPLVVNSDVKGSGGVTVIQKGATGACIAMASKGHVLAAGCFVVAGDGQRVPLAVEKNLGADDLAYLLLGPKELSSGFDLYVDHDVTIR